MTNFTPLIRPVFAWRAAAFNRWHAMSGFERTQRQTLAFLLAKGAKTVYGHEHAFGNIASYENFAANVPVVEYEQIRPLVMRMVQGEKDVLWPGRCTRFAQSSGTSGGKSKYIPITTEALHRNHYGGAFTSVASYLALYSHSRLFAGKSFILGGSFANELTGIPPGVKVGDLSAALIGNINPLVNLFRIPDKSIALMADWNAKLPALVETSMRGNVTNISGVPSWFMTVLQKILERTSASSIHDVWPNLEVFFHGGIAFGPYRQQYSHLCDPARMHYHENYNASEGFFAVQDTPEGGSMRLIPDIGVFFEFKPTDNPSSPPLPAWRLEEGKIYSLILTSCNGLWRYAIGDTVLVHSVEPLRISIAGRTASFINAFGEELMVWNADKAIAETCRKTGATIANYTAAPVFADCGQKGHHQWLIEWHRQPQGGTEHFAQLLDAELCALNSDYQAKRAGNIFLAPLEIVSLPEGSFDRWLASTGKLGGQRKIPRLCNDRRIADAILLKNRL